MTKQPRCVIILSSKSSGSSALQRLLCHANGRHVEHTRHAEDETLYWTKAASVLHLPQSPMLGSEVPIAPRKARSDLIELLAQNAPEFSAPQDERTLIFEGWRALCMHYAPLFVEKSPHHLHQWSCLELMAEAAARLPDIEFRFLGLVRNPMDMIYSAWIRWRLPPKKVQFEWLRAYQNLLRFKALMKDRLTIVPYESLATQRHVAEVLGEVLEVDAASLDAAGLIHGQSMLKWKRDRRFGFELDSGVAAVAAKFGYTPDELANHSTYRWKLHELATRSAEVTWFRPKSLFKHRVKRIIRWGPVGR